MAWGAGRGGERNAYRLYRGAGRVAAAVPDRAALPLGRALGAAAWAVLPRRRALVARHQRRALGAAGDRPLRPAVARRATRAAFVSYGRYWMESLRLPSTPASAIDARFSIEGREHLDAARAAGRGAILALPHVGGWDVGGSWLARQGYPVTVVAEPLEPPELFEWFASLRRQWGMAVVPLGPGAGTGVLRALRANSMVCLLCDRDIGGGGIEVEFFGERTLLPGGPATLALRAGSVILPTAVYFDGDGHRAVVRPPLTTQREGNIRDDVTRLTQELAYALESLITRAPDQWHLFQPNWPSDRAKGR